MSLAQILYPPPTERGWEEWLHAHVRHHEALISALNETKGSNLSIATPIYPVDVKSTTQMATFNRAHLDLHNEMNQLLGIPSQDISSPNFKDQRALDGWLYLHHQMHLSAAALCGQPV